MSNCIAFFHDSSILGIKASPVYSTNVLTLLHQVLFKANNCFLEENWLAVLCLINTIYFTFYFLNIEIVDKTTKHIDSKLCEKYSLFQYLKMITILFKVMANEIFFRSIILNQIFIHFLNLNTFIAILLQAYLEFFYHFYNSIILFQSKTNYLLSENEDTESNNINDIEEMTNLIEHLFFNIIYSMICGSLFLRTNTLMSTIVLQFVMHYFN